LYFRNPNLLPEAPRLTYPSVVLAPLTLGLDQSSHALLLLANDLTVLHANESGQLLLRGTVLRLRNRRLLTGRAPENAKLQAALRDASPTSSLLRLCDREGRGVMILTIQLLEPAPEMPAIIVRPIDLRAPPAMETADIARLFGLSPAESRVATLLLAGNDPASIAEALGVSAETVRTHLKQAMVKTATHSQAQLTGVLLRGAQTKVSS
jgi:DNA-binding CsgD family transcriptional regulator